MLIYKQRYKPRTTREFTKSDLTVYDSAGNTALNALTIYGKSEVVDGAITSAGEGYAVVDLGSLTWEYKTAGYWLSSDISAVVELPATRYDLGKIIAQNYINKLGYQIDVNENSIGVNTSGSLLCNNGSQTNPPTGVLAYQLADPTQGNAIAIKTDDGTGIDGTMATFTTGTPLRGIPDTDVRDVMQWDGSAGTVTKKCGAAKLKDIIIGYSSQYNFFYSYTPMSALKTNSQLFTPNYNYIGVKYDADMNNAPNMSIAISGTQIKIKNTNYTTVEDFVSSLGDAELVYELATPTTQFLTTAENDSIAGLRTFEPQTHAQNNAQTEMTVDYTIRVPTI